MKGTYRFYQEGRLIHESENLITTEGKRAILRYLAGRGGTIGAALALGTGTSVATVADRRLTFEVDRATISLVSVLFNDDVVVFKATIPQEVEYTIYEAGIYNQPTATNNVDNSRLLATFETELDEWTVGTVTPLNARTGSEGLLVSPGASATLEPQSSSVMDLDSFTADDNFTVAFYKGNTNCSAIALKFYDLNGNSFSLSKSVTSLANTSYHVVTFRKGDFVVTGPITWDAIVKMGVAVTAGAGGTADFYLDGVRIEDDDSINPDYALVSRSVLGTPVVKTTEAPMDIEYALELNIT